MIHARRDGRENNLQAPEIHIYSDDQKVLRKKVLQNFILQIFQTLYHFSNEIVFETYPNSQIDLLMMIR